MLAGQRTHSFVTPFCSYDWLSVDCSVLGSKLKDHERIMYAMVGGGFSKPAAGVNPPVYPMSPRPPLMSIIHWPFPISDGEYALWPCREAGDKSRGFFELFCFLGQPAKKD